MLITGTLAQADKWRLRANNFREQAEPFDIANYYLSGLNVRSGPYLHRRPGVYAVFEQKWRDDCREEQLRGDTGVPQGQRGQSAQHMAVPASTIGDDGHQADKRSEVARQRRKVLETYIDTLPWARQAEEKIGWTAVGSTADSWMPEGPALGQKPVVEVAMAGSE